MPPLSEQEAINALLHSWQSAIEKTEQLIQAKQRLHAVQSRGLLLGSTRLDSRSPTAMRPLHFFSVPADWPLVALGDIANELSTFANSGLGPDLPVLSCTKHAGLVESLSYFKKQVFSRDTGTYKAVRRGQFVYATNHLEEGSIGLLDSVDRGLVSPMYTVFEADSTRVDHGFLYRLLKTETLRKIFAARTNASVDRRGGLRWREFARIQVALPSLEEQKRISEVLDASSRELVLLRARLRAFRTQKRGLMQRLLTGEWRLPKISLTPSPESV